MIHYWSLDDLKLDESWLTIGSFDGVHRGHQEIVRTLAAGAHQQGVPAVVLTFHPHPSVVLGKRSGSLYLTTPEQRAALLGDLGVDVVIIHPFNPQVAAMTAHDFLAEVEKHLHTTELWVGHDFALGRKREGDIPRLTRLGEEFGYVLKIIQPYKLDGEVVSSSLIRELLLNGDVERAAYLLGRPYRLGGPVVPGDGRGRTIGIPTANLDVWADMVLPKSGVYVCQAHIKGRAYKAVTNVGVRPTFETEKVISRVEAYILDFDEDIYGQTVELDFLTHLRDEQRFPSVQALVDQIHSDIEKTRQTVL